MQALLTHQRRPDAGQIPLRQIRVPGKEVLRRNESQHAVPQKLQPFVAAQPLRPVLVGIGAVVQGLPQQLLVAEGIVQILSPVPASLFTS